MKNLVEKFSAQTAEVAEDDGAVAIEYVLVAAAVAVGVAVVFGTTLWTELQTRLNNII